MPMQGYRNGALEASGLLLAAVQEMTDALKHTPVVLLFAA
jgi:hypothetical protein